MGNGRNGVPATLRNFDGTRTRQTYVSDPPPVAIKKHPEVWHLRYGVDLEISPYDPDLKYFKLVEVLRPGTAEEEAIYQEVTKGEFDATHIAQQAQMQAQFAELQRHYEEQQAIVAAAKAQQQMLQAQLPLTDLASVVFPKAPEAPLKPTPKQECAIPDPIEPPKRFMKK